MVSKAAQRKDFWTKSHSSLKRFVRQLSPFPCCSHSSPLAGSNRGQRTRRRPRVEKKRGAPADCFDVTPHEVTFVKVAPGVRLEVLDFGGSGETMVLLTGLGDNAHVWDDFAYQFSDFFGSLALPAGLWSIGPARRRLRRSHEGARRSRGSSTASGSTRLSLSATRLAGSELSELSFEYPDRVHSWSTWGCADLAERFVVPKKPAGPPYTDEDGEIFADLSSSVSAPGGISTPKNAAACNGFTF